ncbi:DUF664 domain-containing protein [Actinomadura meridiana]|uniref:DUF664 domain-containing protein n=1 Tax=Actinomadura meridiana TaxID=559626 RepID=A0ABP8BTG5_9ACTN
MTSALLLTDAFGRIREQVHGAVDGLTPQQLAYRADADANSIAWLLWHLTRVEDDHISDVAGTAQAWTEGGWADRFGLPFDPSDTGYRHTSAQVAAVQVPSADLLTGYQDAVHAETVAYVSTVTDDDLPRVVDRSWDPPVTLGVRLVSVISDCIEHTGQAAFVRGLLLRA